MYLPHPDEPVDLAHWMSDEDRDLRAADRCINCGGYDQPLSLGLSAADGCICTGDYRMPSRNVPSRDNHVLPDWNPRRVAAEPGHTCEVNECGAPAILCDLYAEEPEPRFLCWEHRLS